MEKIKRKVRLFFVSYGKLLFQVIGTIVLIICVIQGLNQYVISENKEKEKIFIATKDEREKQKKKEENIKIDKEVILKFIDYCNNKKIKEAYELVTQSCKDEKYKTIKDFEEKYINKIFNKKRECEIVVQDDNTYKVILLEDVLQSGSIDNRGKVIDYYIVKEDVLGEKTIDINIYNNI